MTSVVCQGLQSCLEPQPRVLRNKHSVPPKSKNSQEHENNSNDENEGVGCDDSNIKGINNGGWSFIQALTNRYNNAKQPSEQTDDNVYVHPLVKRSASALSLKSLEMCTESLGSETGSDDIVISNEFSSLSSAIEEEEVTLVSFQKKSVNQSDYRRTLDVKHNVSRSFPPPLSSFIGNDVGGGVQVRPHREGGRLIIKAVTVSSSSHTNFQADRTNGRLKLSLVKNCSVISDNGELVKEQKEGDQEVVEFGHCDDLIGEGEEVDEEGCCWGEEMEGSGGEMGDEAEIEELSKPSRCKENGRGSQGMSSWGPFCVAIS